MRRLPLLLVFLAVGCVSGPPQRSPPSPRFDRDSADQCVKRQLEQRIDRMGAAVTELSSTDRDTIAEEAVDRCNFPTGFDRTSGLNRARIEAGNIQSRLARPFRERQNAEATRANIERDERRRRTVDAAGTRYLACVLNAAIELASLSDEAAPVIVDAARGSCPTEAAALRQADWQMISEIDTQARPMLIARVLRARSQRLQSAP